MEQDPLVEKLVPDPSELPKVRVLIGWLGRSQREGYWRLYVTPSLDEYLEFREEDIRHNHNLNSNESPLGGTVVWISDAAEILQKSSTATAAEREFLRGEISQAFLPAAGFAIGGRSGPRGGPAAINTWICENQTAGTCTLVLCTKVDECRISREANPCV
jgi:hypothetical protein